MEGRSPPPKAEHPYPNNPDLTKIWGTPYAKSLFKSFGIFLTGYMFIIGVNMYLTRHQRGPFGMDIMITKEQYEKVAEIREETAKLKRLNIPIQARSKDLETLVKPQLLFDDGAEYNPAIPRA